MIFKGPFPSKPVCGSIKISGTAQSEEGKPCRTCLDPAWAISAWWSLTKHCKKPFNPRLWEHSSLSNSLQGISKHTFLLFLFTGLIGCCREVELYSQWWLMDRKMSWLKLCVFLVFPVNLRFLVVVKHFAFCLHVFFFLEGASWGDHSRVPENKRGMCHTALVITEAESELVLSKGHEILNSAEMFLCSNFLSVFSLQSSPSYHEVKRRCEYLHKKLSHIKGLVEEFDKQQGESWH